MIIAFFKSHDDRNCECEVAKFVDRIWVQNTGDIRCIRTFIIHVKESSKSNLSAVRILTPFQQIPDLQDLSQTCLQPDYLYNEAKFSTGGFTVKHFSAEKDYGKVSYDYFQDVDVYTENQIKSYDTPEKLCRVISFDFLRHPVQAGEFRLVRYSFRLTSMLDEVFPRIYNFKLTYFDKQAFSKEFELLGIDALEIPAKTLYDRQTKGGGFDVFVYLDENLKSTNFNANTQTTANHLPDGTQSQKLAQKFIWRARMIFPIDIDTLLAGKAVFSVEGLVNDPFELEELRNEISTLKRGHRKSFWVGIIALFVSFFSLLLWLILNDSLRAWVALCFQNGNP